MFKPLATIYTQHFTYYQPISWGRASIVEAVYSLQQYHQILSQIPLAREIALDFCLHFDMLQYDQTF